MSRPRKILLSGGAVLVATFALLQLRPVERTNPPVISDVGAPAEVDTILRRSCYDCHSHETRWPWYSHVAPMAWFVADHVEHARSDLNFSNWPAFDFQAQRHAFDDIRHQLETGKMPLASYLILHPSARLSEEDRALLLRWAGVSQ